MNQVTLSGKLGNDPELRQTTNSAVLTFRLATEEDIKSGGKWTKHTEWHSVTVWGRRGEALSNLLSKGQFVVVSGKLRTREFEGRDGSKKRVTEINADNVEFGPRQRGNNNSQGDYAENQGSAEGDYGDEWDR